MSIAPVATEEAVAVAGLDDSRQQLRDALHGIAHPPRHPFSLRNGVSGVAAEVLARARELPGVGLGVDMVGKAWQGHPAHDAVETTLARYRPAIERTVRQQPLTALSVAAGTGALLWLARPWRLLLRPKTLAKVLPAVARQVASEVPAVPRRRR